MTSASSGEADAPDRRPDRRGGFAQPILFATLMLSFVGLSPVALSGGEAETMDATVGDGDALRQIVFVLLFGGSIWNTWTRRGARDVLAVPAGVLIVLGWCWLSLAWAIAPDIAVRRLVFTTMVIAIVAQSCRSLSVDEGIRALFWALLVTVLLDWVAIGLLPLSVHQPGGVEPELAGDWRGMQSHKNVTGGICAIALFTFLYMWKRTRSRYVVPLAALLALVFLWNSGSKTSLGLVPVAALLGWAITVFHRSLFVRAGVGGALCVAALAGVVYVNKITDFLYLLDDPAALTGRSQIWPVLLKYHADHPLLGAGYGSFWAIGSDSPINQYASGWIVTFLKHAHNGYLDILVQIGLLGLILALCFLVAVPLYHLATLPFPSERLRSYLSAVLVFGLFHNFLETSLLDRVNPVWIAMLIVYCLIDRVRVRVPRAAHPPRDGLIDDGPGPVRA